MRSPDARALLAALHEAAVQGAAPFACTRDAVRRWWTGRGFARDTPVHLFALGKASPAMAAGALAALAPIGVPIAGGVIVAAHDPTETDWHGEVRPASMRVLRGDHPVPGFASLDAADAIDDAVIALEPEAVALVLLSGGTTALCAAPIAPLAQLAGDADRAQATIASLVETLLESGLAIHEMNAIRRRLLRFGAGRLAVQLVQHGAAHIGAFAISDVIGDDPAVIGSGPCSPDPLDDASFLALLDAHELRLSLDRELAQFLGLLGSGAPPAVPGPQHPAFARVHYELVARNADALQALAARARADGVDMVLVDPMPLEGEAEALGESLARRALALAPSVPEGTRALLVSGGEPVVHLRATIDRALERHYRASHPEHEESALDAALPGLAGVIDDGRADALADDEVDPWEEPTLAEPLRGGRMQVLALSAALTLEQAAAQGDRQAWRIHLLAAGTDGRDGPTDAAGAIVDAVVPGLARRGGRQPEDDLVVGRSWYALDAAGALLRTGPTGTNVMDVVAVLIA